MNMCFLDYQQSEANFTDRQSTWEDSFEEWQTRHKLASDKSKPTRHHSRGPRMMLENIQILEDEEKLSDGFLEAKSWKINTVIFWSLLVRFINTMVMQYTTMVINTMVNNMQHVHQYVVTGVIEVNMNCLSASGGGLHEDRHLDMPALFTRLAKFDRMGIYWRKWMT